MKCIAILVVLAGCASSPDARPPPIRGTGELVNPPSGWTDYCYRHGEEPACLRLREQIARDRATP